ncbi:MAG: hypothetical protein HY909_07895 [Deltaproteobacteria bacterium]|nr:hypothetical protein [Deltaproteobacteria bacterium]
MSVAPAIPGVEAPPLVAPSPPPLVGVMDAAPASPTLAVGDGSVAPTAEDAPAVLAAADVEAVAPDVGLLATAGDSAAPAPAADPPPTPVVAADAAVAPTVAASSPPLEDHPKVRDVVRVTNSLRSRVLSCIAGRRSRRHVRVLAEYEGATGRVFSVRLVGGYADPPTGPCIEGAVRALPYTPFREERWTQSYVYNLGD